MSVPDSCPNCHAGVSTPPYWVRLNPKGEPGIWGCGICGWEPDEKQKH